MQYIILKLHLSVALVRATQGMFLTIRIVWVLFATILKVLKLMIFPLSSFLDIFLDL